MNPTKSVGNFALNFQKEYSKLLLDYIWGRGTMKKLENTQYFKIQSDQELKVGEILQLVYQAMTEKGYDPVNQIVGYIMSGDPTYITSHKGARSLIMKVERDELVEELLRVYIDKTVKG